MNILLHTEHLHIYINKQQYLNLKLEIDYRTLQPTVPLFYTHEYNLQDSNKNTVLYFFWDLCNNWALAYFIYSHK